MIEAKRRHDGDEREFGDGESARAASIRRDLVRLAHFAATRSAGEISTLNWRHQMIDALVLGQVDARRDRVALAALEGAQAAEVDEHRVAEVASSRRMPDFGTR